MDAAKTALLLSSAAKTTLIARENSPLQEHYSKDLRKEGINVETIKFRTSFSLTLIMRVRKIIKKNDIKNIIFFGSSEIKSLYFSVLGKNINLIVRHGTTKTTSKKDIFHLFLYSKVRWHIAISKHIAKNVSDIFPIANDSQIKVIYLSAKHKPNARTIVARKPTSKGHVNILHIGRIIEGKGQLEAIQACHILNDKNIPFQLTIVGEPDISYMQKIQQLVSALEYKQNIKIMGYRNNVSEFYENCDVFLYPSYGEGLGNVVIEALSYGKKCVCFNNTVFPEIQSLGFKLFLAEDRDINSLKEQLLSSIQISDWEYFSRLNKQLAKKHFSTKNELEQYLSILE